MTCAVHTAVTQPHLGHVGGIRFGSPREHGFSGTGTKTLDDNLTRWARQFRQKQPEAKIDDIRSNLLTQQSMILNTADLLCSPEETLESFALVDSKMLGRVFSQVNPHNLPFRSNPCIIFFKITL